MVIPFLRLGLQRGPTGPPGPAGAEISREDMVKEFKKLVKSAAAKRAKKIVKEQVTYSNPQ